MLPRMVCMLVISSEVGGVQVGAMMHFLACNWKPASWSAASRWGSRCRMSLSLWRILPRSSAQALISPRLIAFSSLAM
eukprot:5731487-Pyramimonas_sp.AAC.1